MDNPYIKFNAGVWSDVLLGRHDLGNYRSASRTCSNFIPTRYGQVEKRPGTKHLGYAKHDDKVAVLHPFQFSVNTKFFLEFGDLYIRFWSNDLLVESGGSPVEVVTPYLEAELYELQLRAINDTVYIVHPNHPVGVLTRVADDDWTYGVAPLSLPYVDPDVISTDVTLTPSATTGSITLTASSAAFEADHVGSGVRLCYVREGTSQSFDDDYILNPDSYDDTLDAFDKPTTFDATLGDYETDGDNSKYWKVEHHVTGNFQEFWTCILDYNPSAWATAAEHLVDELVTNGGSAYVCIQVNGTDTTEYEPGVTSGWESYWDLVDSPDDAPNYFTRGAITMQPVEVFDEWSLKTTGNWRGEWWIQRSKDDGVTWSTIKVIVSDNDSNYLVEDDEDGEQALIRVLGASSNSSSIEKETVVFSVLSGLEYGTATIDAFTSDVLVDATVVDEMPSTNPSVSWTETAFSAIQGYPRSIALFDNRLVLAGTAKKPQAFFYSAINDYVEFLGGTLADAPFYVETLSDDQSAVQWISAQKELFIGTASVEGVMITRKQDEAQSAENLPIIRWQESMGSASRRALVVRDALMVLQRGRTTINMLSYSLEKDGYRGEEVTLLCPHLFTSGIQQMTNIREPYTGVYVVTEAGTLCHMIYEPTLQVTGWCEFSTSGGTYESVQSLPGTGSEDDLWCVVKRTIDGTTRRHIEKFITGNTLKQSNQDADNLWYLDNAIKTTGSAMTSVSGLDHLEGEEISVLADGVKGTYTVASGSITLAVAADTVIAGLPITSEFEPLDLEAQQTVGGRKNLFQCRLMLWRSLGGQIASNGKDYEVMDYHTAGEIMDESVPLLDGFKEVSFESSHGRQKFFRIKHDEPYPFTLQAVIQTFKPTRK